MANTTTSQPRPPEGRKIADQWVRENAANDKIQTIR
jgi:hypothetical protein